MKELNKMKITFSVIGIAASMMMACAGKEEYNGLGHDGLDYDGETVAMKVFYNVKLSDPNVHEVANVLVQYIDSLGNTQQDTLNGDTWAKAVVYKRMSTMNYGLAAHYFSKKNATLTKESYHFGADLTSKVFQISSMGDSLQVGKFTSLKNEKDNECTSILRYYKDSSMDKAEASTQAGRDAIDTTMVYFRLTSLKSDSAIVRSKFVWKE